MARLLAPVTVAVYRVRGCRVVPGVRAKVATVLLASSVTVPVGLVQDAAQVTVKLAAPVIGAIASLKEAAMTGLLVATPVALLAGVTAVTVGAIAAVAPPDPRIGARPWPPPLQPASTALISKPMDSSRYLEQRVDSFILFSLSIGSRKPLALTADRGRHAC